MLLKREDSYLVLIDVQEKLIPFIQRSEDLVERCHWLMRLATEFQIPCMVSEQYPKGLGKTVQGLQNFSIEPVLEKVDFSCWRALQFKEKLQKSQKKQLVLIGIETHVCVLQTAFDLLDADYEVFVVVDAVNSRKDLDHKYGLERMKQAGVKLITSEMVFFEWMSKAGTPEFKTLSKAYLQ